MVILKEHPVVGREAYESWRIGLFGRQDSRLDVVSAISEAAKANRSSPPPQPASRS